MSQTCLYTEVICHDLSTWPIPEPVGTKLSSPLKYYVYWSLLKGQSASRNVVSKLVFSLRKATVDSFFPTLLCLLLLIMSFWWAVKTQKWHCRDTLDSCRHSTVKWIIGGPSKAKLVLLHPFPQIPWHSKTIQPCQLCLPKYSKAAGQWYCGVHHSSQDTFRTHHGSLLSVSGMLKSCYFIYFRMQLNFIIIPLSLSFEYLADI